jgi:hypothetical protein
VWKNIKASYKERLVQGSVDQDVGNGLTKVEVAWATDAEDLNVSEHFSTMKTSIMPARCCETTKIYKSNKLKKSEIVVVTLCQ